MAATAMLGKKGKGKKQKKEEEQTEGISLHVPLI